MRQRCAGLLTCEADSTLPLPAGADGALADTGADAGAGGAGPSVKKTIVDGCAEDSEQSSVLYIALGSSVAVKVPACTPATVP